MNIKIVFERMKNEIQRNTVEKKSRSAWDATAANEHIGKIAAAIPQKKQYEFGSSYPARAFVKPLPRQYATTLGASQRTVHADSDRK